jgi:group I intron endonuclease
MIIYKITNLITCKFYIGLTIQNINTRFNHHVYEAKLGSTSYLHRSILKHSKENFKIEKLDEAQTIKELQNKEVYYINTLNTTNRKIGYNIAQGGSIGLNGFKHTEESKLKMSKSSKGKIASLETKQKMSKIRKGKSLPESANIKVKLYNKKVSKIVIKTNIDGSIQEYESISETAKQNNIDPKSLSGGLNNKRGFYTDRNKCVYKIK